MRPLVHQTSYANWHRSQRRSVTRFTLVLIALWATPAWAPSAIAASNETAGGLVILQYHHIDDSTPASTSTSPAIFQEHLAYIATNAFNVIALADAVTSMRSGEDLPPKSLAITFDDAFESIYTTALPLLVQYEMPFTVFVATDYLDRPGYMSIAQMRELLTARASFANHTQSHVHLQRRLEGETEIEWEQRVVREIEGAEQILRENLGEHHKLLAYPYGEYNRRVLSIIDELGYTGFGQQSGAASRSGDFALLPRFPMGGPYSSMTQFPVKVSSLPMPLSLSERVEPLASEVKPVLSLVLAGEGLRLHQFACYGPGGAAEVIRDGAQFTIQGIEPIPAGRSRYNCTMPARVAPGSRQTYHWYSQLWLRKRPDGSWHPD